MAKTKKPKLGEITHKCLPLEKTLKYLEEQELFSKEDFENLDYTIVSDGKFQSCELIKVVVEEKIEMWGDFDRANNKFVDALMKLYPSLTEGEIVLFITE